MSAKKHVEERQCSCRRDPSRQRRTREVHHMPQILMSVPPLGTRQRQSPLPAKHRRARTEHSNGADGPRSQAQRNRKNANVMLLTTIDAKIGSLAAAACQESEHDHIVFSGISNLWRRTDSFFCKQTNNDTKTSNQTNLSRHAWVMVW